MNLFLPYQAVSLHYIGSNISFALYGYFVYYDTAGQSTIANLVGYDDPLCSSGLAYAGNFNAPSGKTVDSFTGLLLGADICTKCFAALPTIGTITIFLGLFAFVFFWLFSTFIERCNGCCCWKGGAITYWISWAIIFIIFVMSIVIFTEFAPCGAAIDAYAKGFSLDSPRNLAGMNMAAAILAETILIILFMLLVRMPYTVTDAAASAGPMSGGEVNPAYPQAGAPAYPPAGAPAPAYPQTGTVTNSA